MIKKRIQEFLPKESTYLLSFCLIVSLLYPDHVLANNDGVSDYRFNSGFLIGSKNQVDLNRFSVKTISEGIYSFDVYTNDHWQGRYDLNIITNNNGQLGLCYTEKMLSDFGVITSRLNKKLSQDPEICSFLSDWLDDPNIYDQLNPSTLRLDLFLPQLYLKQLERGYVSEELWDKGIPALNLGYSATYYYSKDSKYNQDNSSFYLGINAGLSFDGWLLKHSGNMSWNSLGSLNWNSNQTYLERPIAEIKSKLLIGQFYTNGDLFDSTNLRGAQLGTSTKMYPDSMINYAPDITGMAQSNALVTVYQNDKIIYQTSVPPGPFYLTDVNPIGYGYDLKVTIKEADGSETFFMVPYSSLPNLLRPGFTQYQLATGQVDMSNIKNRPYLIQGTLQHGLNNTITLSSGTTLFNDYQSLLMGAGFNTVLGAFELNATYSRTNLSNNIAIGQSYRATFSQLFTPTSTNIMLSTYRYSTKDYFGINDAIYAIDYDKRNLPNYRSKEKNGYNLVISQSLPDGWGDFYFNGRISNYWGNEAKNKQYQLSYNNTYRNFSYTLTGARVYDNYNRAENRLSFNFTIPLTVGSKKAYLHSYTSFNDTNFSSTQAGMNGSFDDDYNWTYGINVSIPREGKNSLSLNTGYRNAISNMSASYSVLDDNHQLSASMSGGMVLHENGLTFTNSHAKTMVLIEAKNANGATVDGDRFSSIDSNGYALDNTVRPYRLNHIGVDPIGSPEDTVFTSISGIVVPYEGSITKLTLETRKESTYILNISRFDDQPLPFGSDITYRGKTIGMVGQGGTAFLHDISMKKARIIWENGNCYFAIPEDLQQDVICY